MRFDPPGRFESVEAFAARWSALRPGAHLPPRTRGADGPLGRPIQILRRTLGNRFAVQPMEGWDGTPGGAPTEHTLRRWRRLGRSGADLVWGGEAYAVCAEGRANPNQLFHNDAADPADDLRDLLGALRDGRREIGGEPDDLLVGLQLTHSGRFAQPGGEPRPRIAFRHPLLDSRLAVDPADAMLRDDELEAIAERFVIAAGTARAAGFDFVDVKCCHGYLLHELLAAHTRPGPYGGSFENRTRLLRRIVEGIRDTSPDLAIAVRVSITDRLPHAADPDGIGAPHPGAAPLRPYRYAFGVDPDDPAQPDTAEQQRFLDLLVDLGVELVNVTIGSPYYCPHVQRPAAYPPSDGYEPPEDPLLGVVAHLEATRRCKAMRPDLVVVGSGYTYLQEYLPHVAEDELERGHVDLIGLGRMMLSYPELPRDLLAGRPLDRRSICRTFSDCTTAPRHGLASGCYPLDAHYKGSTQAARLRTIKKERRP